MEIDLQPFSGPEHLPFEIGEGPAGCLLIHGFPGTPAEMRPIGEVLCERGWRARGILLPGFGPEIVTLNSKRREDWLGAAESAWADLREPGHPAVLIGYSMGAAVALNLAASHPPDLLVLISPFWRVHGILARLVPVLKWLIPEFYPFKEADFSSPELRGLFEQVMPEVDLEDPQVQEEIRSSFGLSMQVIHEILRLGKDAYRAGKRIQCPTVVIQGEDDLVVRPADTRKLARRIGRSTADYHELEGGHSLIQDGSSSRPAVKDLILQGVSGLG